MNKFDESKLEIAIIKLLKIRGYEHYEGEKINRSNSEQVLILDDIKQNLSKRYKKENITSIEIENIIKILESFPTNDLYESNKKFTNLLTNGFQIKREDPDLKDIYIHLIDFSNENQNIYRFVTQLEINGYEIRIPDGVLFVNGLPIVIFEFKSAIREKATIADAYNQITKRYRRDIPNLFVFNTFCIISDGVNSKMGSFFAPYENFYSWRKITGEEKIDKEGINSLYSLIEGLFDQSRLREVIHHFIYFPDNSRKEIKVVCRYPQFYAATKLYKNILSALKPLGKGKGGTYFGATGCGKSFVMLFLTRILMRSSSLESPTIIIITDRNDLDDQISEQFINSKNYIGDSEVINVINRQDLRERLENRVSGGVFLTTIQKFTEELNLLSKRTNVICISDEAHRTQINLNQKIKLTPQGVKKSFGFAKHLHESLPNATYVGFTGTPVDGTLEVFGDIVDTYTMTEAVYDSITVRIVYEGRSAEVLLDQSKLEEIEDYYRKCRELGSSEYAIEESKKINSKLNLILTNPSRIKAIAIDFINHYERRIAEKSSLLGKAMFICNSREAALALYKEIIQIRPDWNEKQICNEKNFNKESINEIKPIERIKLVMTQNKDKDSKFLWELLGNKEYKKELDRQFKNPKSNFKIAIVVDMWTTGFDVPFLDTMYIDKLLQKHNLIQTISRVNRKFGSKEKGLIVDYIGIQKAMNQSLAAYGGDNKKNIEDIKKSLTVTRDYLNKLNSLFEKFDKNLFFNGDELEQLQCLNCGVEFIQQTKKTEELFMNFVKRLKLAYDICSGSELLEKEEIENIYFYCAIRSILFKLIKGNSPDIFEMNNNVEKMIAQALNSNSVQEILKIGQEASNEIDIFDEEYLLKIQKIKLPNTKIKILQQLLARAIDNYKNKNQETGTNFSKKFSAVVEKYNQRDDYDQLKGEVLEEFTEEIVDMIKDLQNEQISHLNLGITFEEKAIYDILKSLTFKYEFIYEENKLIDLAKDVKQVVNEKVRYTDWNKKDDIKAELKFDLIVLLDKYGYPPATHDEAYKSILEQAQNFQKTRL